MKVDLPAEKVPSTAMRGHQGTWLARDSSFREKAEPPGDLVEAPEGPHRVEQDRVLFPKVPFEAIELSGQGVVHRTGSSCAVPARQGPERPPDFSSSRTPAMVIPRSTALHMS